MILSAARRHEVDPLLVQAVIRAESNFDPRARSRRGARGLMQLMPSTLRQYAVDNPYDPAANIDAGTRHLRGLLDRFELKGALAAYNAGRGAVHRHRGVPPFAETEAYVSRVLRELSGPPAVGPATSNP
jgi:soluble lytic murein transglycosylase-like protein